MPTTTQSVSISGETQEGDVPTVYVTYQQPILGGVGNPTIDAIPAFLYLTGQVEYRQDSAGNVLAVTRNKDGSLPT